MSPTSRPSKMQFTKSGALRLYSTQELITLPPPTWQIDGIVPMGAFVALYGPPGNGKTFVALDMAMSVATGTKWNGQDVDPGSVLYISGEGGAGIGKRAAAWLQVKGIKPERARIMWLLEAIPVYADSPSIQILLDRIEQEVREYPSLVVVDTLARCFDGNENEQEDMGRFVAGIDRLRKEFDATLLILHHSRLDGTRERGNTSFKGAADTMIKLSHDSGSMLTTLSCEKQKDFEDFPSIDMLRTVVDLGNGVTSCIMQSLENENTEENRIHRSEILFDIISRVHPATYSQIKEASGVHMKDSTLKRALKDLKKLGLISCVDGIYEITEGPPS